MPDGVVLRSVNVRVVSIVLLLVFRTILRDITEKGTLSNIISAILFAIGALLMYIIPATKGS